MSATVPKETLVGPLATQYIANDGDLYVDRDDSDSEDEE